MEADFYLLGRQNCPAGSSYYACSTPFFRGCCSVDACQNNGCPDSSSSLASPKSSSPKTTLSTFIHPDLATTTETTTTQPRSFSAATAGSSQSSALGLAQTSPSPGSPTQTEIGTDSDNGPDSHPNIGLIVGLVLAGVVIIALAIISYLRRSRKGRAWYAGAAQASPVMADGAGKLDRFGGFFSRVSLLKTPWILSPDASQTGSPSTLSLSPYSACKEKYSKETVLYLASTSIHELGSTPKPASPVELTASNSIHQQRDANTRRQKDMDPTRPHVMSWSEYGSVESRLSGPLVGPDLSREFWGRMSVPKPRRLNISDVDAELDSKAESLSTSRENVIHAEVDKGPLSTLGDS